MKRAFALGIGAGIAFYGLCLATSLLTLFDNVDLALDAEEY